MARPRKDIDPQEVEKWASINCSTAEIGAQLGCSADTLQRRYAAALEKGRERGKGSLKARMFEIAMGKKNTDGTWAERPNITMMIWLSKQILGYRDKVEEVVTETVKGDVTFKAEWGSNQETPTGNADT